MKHIPRRSFLKNAGQAAAFGYLGSNLVAASGRVALIADPADPLVATPPIQWALGELKQAIEAKGAACAIVPSATEFATAIAVGNAPSGREGFRITPEAISSKPGLRVSASDSRGCVYALTELADRVRHGGDPVAALRQATPLRRRVRPARRSISC